MARATARAASAAARLRFAQGALAVWTAAALTLAASQVLAATPPGTDPHPGDGRGERTVNEWLARMQDASRVRSYVGTFVVSSGNGAMSSARIWHACDGRRQFERIESLSGERRSTFRRDDEVLTFLPQTHTVRRERRESLGEFPEPLKPDESPIPEFYAARRVGSDRVAGFETDVVQVVPKDNLRYGYRIWSEQKTGLMVKQQTLDENGGVLEQAAFSELQINAPVSIERLSQMMAVPAGWRVEKPQAAKTTAAAEGWGLKASVAGFKPMNCYKRPDEGVLQWIFSDGLASVSLFIEDFDRERHVQEGVFASGATHTLTRRVQDWWVTVVGEVPPQTLQAFAAALERRR
ncbi:MucB/RseB C-terminal domain-containing protein [Ramlibacter ginsenosidimutans]|uniref:MucB/RseB C-terminal domain-containing protein n=1 Tax=Ramlibacter ginsenosidimutans TaxID=502333 RepID=A0A934TU42_9BURK|nr:MucB/RseB C-terminal domain-containing protein [Ramlibacter ginsenosidimutans]MBK6006925.1 MucB/RseB C-terminal domain-containing protein [Ramlibacter ginsenosidimutans]